jgi:diacylglycerol O-acyltransferase
MTGTSPRGIPAALGIPARAPVPSSGAGRTTQEIPMARRPIPPQDSLWLHLDRPSNLLVITSVLWTSDPVDPARLRTVVGERLLDRYPVFRQRAVSGGGALRTAYWEDDPDFDLDRHLVVGPMPKPATREALQEFVAARRSEPLDRDHPLWTVYLLEGFGRGSALVQRFHHAMADGIRLTQVMLGLLDPVGSARSDPVRVGSVGPVGDGANLSARIASLVRRLGGAPVLGAAGVAASVLPRAVRPGHVLDLVTDAGRTVAHTAAGIVKLATWSNPPTALAGEPGVDKTAAWGDPLPLDLLRWIAHATGTSIGDVCATLVAGATARYLAGCGGRVNGSGSRGDLAWMVPVNLEPFDAALPAELGNHFALVLAVLPHGPAGFLDRLAEVHRRLAAIRDSYEPLITYGLARGIAVAPAGVGPWAGDLLADKAVGVLSNVPGPRAPMALAGARVEGVVGWAPCSAHQTVTACVFSYAGTVSVGFGTDRTVVPDPGQLVAAFDAEVAAATEAVRGARLA